MSNGKKFTLNYTYPRVRGRCHGYDPDAQIHPKGVDVEEAQKCQERDQVPALFPKRWLAIAVGNTKYNYLYYIDGF